MLFVCYKPHPLLRNYIKCYSFIEGDFRKIRIKPIPDGRTIEAGIVHTPNLQVKYQGKNNLADFKSYVGGLLHNIEYIRFSGFGKYIGIVMYPYTIRYLFNGEPETLKEHIDFEVYFKEKGKLLIEEILSLNTYYQKVNCIDKFLIKHLKSKKEIDYKSSFLFSQPEKFGNYGRMKDLCKYMNATPKTLQGYFKDIIGVCPKEFLKINQVNNIINVIKTNSKLSVHDIVCDYNYYDQSHLISDIKKSTGYTLNQLMKIIRTNTLPYTRNLIFEQN